MTNHEQQPFLLDNNPVLSNIKDTVDIIIKGKAPVTLVAGVPSVPLAGTLDYVYYKGGPWVYRHPSGLGYQAPTSHAIVVDFDATTSSGLVLKVSGDTIPLTSVKRAKVHLHSSIVSNLLSSGPVVLYGEGSIHETLWNDGKHTEPLTGHLDYLIHQSVNWYHYGAEDGKVLPGKAAVTRVDEITLDLGGQHFVRALGNKFYPGPSILSEGGGGSPNEKITFNVDNQVAGPWAVAVLPTVGSSVLGTPVNPIPESILTNDALVIRGSPNALEGLTATITYTLGGLQFVVQAVIPSFATGVSAPPEVATILNSSPTVKPVLKKTTSPPDPVAPLRHYIYTLTIAFA